MTEKAMRSRTFVYPAELTPQEDGRLLVRFSDLPEALTVSSGGTEDSPPGFFQERARKVESFERDYLKNLLVRFNGDTNQAAEEARIPRGTLYRLIKKYEINPKDFRA